MASINKVAEVASKEYSIEQVGAQQLPTRHHLHHPLPPSLRMAM
jgi:hypothetical protein